MKFYATPYHSNLIKDKDRLAVFLEGIDDFFNDNMDGSNNYNNNNCNNNDYNDPDRNFKHEKLGTVMDIGCGSGILSYFASKYFDNVIAIDIDSKIIDYAKKSFDEAKIKNVVFINEDASSYLFDEFDELVDLIICEMLDTALIDEEEVPVLKNVKKYLKIGGKIIPQGIINIAEPVYMEKDYIHYEDEDFHGKKPKYKVLGKPIKIGEFDFLEDFEADFETIIDFNFNNIININNANSTNTTNGTNGTNSTNTTNSTSGTDSTNTTNSTNGTNNAHNANDNNSNKFNNFNGIKITTFTKVNENIICGPTPMFNPPLFIPVDTRNRIENNVCSVKLEYSMGKGVESIKTSIIHKNIT